MTAPFYSIDSSALIHAWHRHYRPKNFGFIWDSFHALIDEGRLRASVEVLGELERKEDDLFKSCRERKEKFCIEIDDACQTHVAVIMGRYPRLVDTVRGRSGADPFVIALAAVNDPTMIVVTEEQPGKVRIPDVCTAENIECIGLADLIEKEDWRFP